MKLEVGEFYLSASGEVIKIDTFKEDSFISNTKDSFFKNGLYINGEKHKFDLIAHIPKELHHSICELINDYHTNNYIKEYEDAVIQTKIGSRE